MSKIRLYKDAPQEVSQLYQRYPVGDEQDAIMEERQACNATRRATSPDLEEIMFYPFPVLDHGFIRLVDYMGTQESITRSARISYGRGTKSVSDDEVLLHYLRHHDHTTPFESCELQFHMKMPIFVARQFIRHRMASVNEYSARYSVLDNEFYLPDPQDLALQSKTNKQGREEILDPNTAAEVLHVLKEDALLQYTHYENFLKDGIARELARMDLTLNFYTQWYWKMDLKNFMDFLRLRCDHHAQREIRAYAYIMRDIFALWQPSTYKVFQNCVLEAKRFTRDQLKAIRDVIGHLGFAANKSSDQIAYLLEHYAKNYGVGKRDVQEIVDFWQPKLIKDHD